VKAFEVWFGPARSHRFANQSAIMIGETREKAKYQFFLQAKKMGTVTKITEIHVRRRKDMDRIIGKVTPYRSYTHQFATKILLQTRRTTLS